MSVGAQERQADMEADATARAEYEREQAKARQCARMNCGLTAKGAVDGVPYCEEHQPIAVGPDGKPTSTGWRQMGARFRKEMPSKQRKGAGGRTFDYITARQVAKRLDDVVGPGNWSTEVKVIRAEHPVSVLVGVAVFGVWKWDAGYSNNPEADDEADKAYEAEPLKAAVSDGFKRAAVLWGVGRWLYGDA